MGKEILLVSADPNMDEPLHQRLEAMGFAVDRATSAIPGLRAATAKLYDLVITPTYIASGEDAELDGRVEDLLMKHHAKKF